MSRARSLPRVLAALTLLFLASALLPEPQGAEATGFTGQVTHIITGEPIAGAVISLAEQHTLTDDQGWYVLLAPPGRYAVSAHAPGYIGMTQTLQPVNEGLTQLDFAMIPRDPDPEMARLIEEKLMDHTHELSPEREVHVLQAGEVLASGMTSVPRTIRLLIKADVRDDRSEPIEVITLDFEEYLKGVVPAEMPAFWPMEALKAQAVAARSYAAANMGKHAAQGADLCNTVGCQVWRPTYYETTNQAVEATRGIAATYGGNIIYAFYHARCGGHTLNSEQVWGGYLPYARGVPCGCGTVVSGHRVGMCQHGARAMASAGATYDQILRHYYTGIDLLIPQTGALSEPLVEPASGDRATVFTYRVRYRDATGAPPPIANVIIDGRAQTMFLAGGDAANGWTFVYTTTLSAGEHSYRFVFDDGYGQMALAPASGSYAGPTVSATGTPPHNDLRDHITFGTSADWLTGTLDGLQLLTDPAERLTLAPGRSQGTYTSAVLDPGAPFMAYGVFWQAETGGGSAVSIEARASVDGAAWSPWRTLEGELYVPGAQTLLSAPPVFGEARYVQVRARLTAGPGGAQPTLRHMRVALLDTRDGPSSADWPALTAQTAGAPVIITRAQWGANEAWMTWPPEYRTVRAIVLHHTATGDGGLDPAAVVRAIYRYHAVERGWGDIGYNYLVDSFGRIYEGRFGGPGVVGRHVSIYSYGSVGIGMIGNYQDDPVAPAMYVGLTDLTAHQCSLHGIDPMGQTLLIDRVVPTILGHRDLAATLCPGDYLYALLPSIRSDTLAKMSPPPSLTLKWPTNGQPVRAVVTPQIEVNGLVTRMQYYVNGVLRAEAPHAFVWKWNTTLGSDGPYTLRVVAENGRGRAEASVNVQVDNTPPQGVVSAPPWSNASLVPISITSSDAVSMAFSSGWTWEGESLPRWSENPSQFQVVGEPEASGGQALRFLAGQRAGVAFGPYTCALPPGRLYQVAFRLRSDQYTSEAGLATLDVTSEQGRVQYSALPIAGNDLASSAYQEFVLPLDYASQAPSCGTSAADRGLEFRTWFSNAGNLWLDRVRVYTGPQPLASTLWWAAPLAEGPAALTVRLLDAAGNATDHELTVGIDRTSPEWALADGSGYWVRDRLSGLDVNQAAWSHSADGGQTWGPWQPLPLDAPVGVRSAVLLYTPTPATGQVRYRAVDLAGNESISPPLPAGQVPTGESPDRPVFLPVARR